MEIDITMFEPDKYGKDILTWLMKKLQKINLVLENVELGHEEKCIEINKIVFERYVID
jgi:hypothetical protein